MSRAAETMQWVRSQLEAAGQPLSMGELIWRRASAQNKFDAGKVRRVVATSLSNATARMLDNDELRRDVRHLVSFEEVERLYPARTMIIDLHKMRTALVPKLLDLVRKHPDALPRHRELPESAEEHAVHRLRERDPERFARACKEWAPLDHELCQLLGGATGHDRKVLKQVLTAAWGYFEPDVGVRATTMLMEVLSDDQAVAPVIGEALERVAIFFDEVVGNRGLRTAALKRKLYRIAEFRKDHPTGLLSPSVHLLLQYPPRYLQEMPGYKPLDGKPKGRPNVKFKPWDTWSRPDAPPLLWRLIERDVLQPFIFFRLV
jgi:hypothetical protein